MAPLSREEMIELAREGKLYYTDLSPSDRRLADRMLAVDILDDKTPSGKLTLTLRAWAEAPHPRNQNQMGV